MRKFRLLILPFSFFFFPFSSFSDQVIPPQNYGPPYLYPADPKDRLYKLPWKKGERYSMSDGYFSEPGASHHPDYAIDMNLPDGYPLLAVRAGRVSSVRSADMTCNISTSIGNTVLVSRVDSIQDSTSPRANGWRLVQTSDMYLHVRHDVPVKIGDKVEQGQVVAYVSCTGQDGGGPHLHFEVNMTPHAGYWTGDTSGYTFQSIPSPFVEITNRPNGLVEQGDSYTSQNDLYIPDTNISIEAAEKWFDGPAAGWVTVSPNPVSARRASVRFAIPEAGQVEARVLSTGGRLEMVLGRGGYGNRTAHTLPLDVSGLSAGVHLIRIQSAGATLSTRVLVVK